jgi:uncharacterized protein YjbI with pentapeptide repeats
MRKSLEESWRALEAMGHDMPRLPDGTPHLPSRMPNFDDDDRSVNIAFFRTRYADADLSGFTIPKMNFGRSHFERVNFSESELAESRMCWNDFTRCDFTSASLSRCDLRASNFDGCVFRGADLSGADLRRSNFDACIFEGARMAGAIVHKRSASEDLIPLLSKAQLDEIRWVSEVGEEPPGG